MEDIMIILENDTLAISLHPKGAEIHKIVGLQDNVNYMWKRDASQWANSAPILFPIVGALRDNECRIDGKTYTMTQHGFARHNEFNISEQTKNKVVFTLVSNADIQKQYPYAFILRVTYTLEENVLSCHCEVENTDTKDIYFQIGGHPAFACPFTENESSNDYYLEFEQNESIMQKIIDIKENVMSHQEKQFFDQEKRFFIRQELFNNDAIVLKDFISKYVDLKSLNHDKYLRFHMDNFPLLGIWAAKHVGSLIAIEPWNGHNDYVNFTGEFKDKEGVICLVPRDTFACTFKVEIHQ
jgi:galactose mutarotase-like enzyme